MWKKALYVFLISILPIVELRGAIPVGASLDLPFYIYAPMAILGNLLPVPFILLFIPKILDWLERFRLFRPLIQWIRKKANRGLIKMQKYDKKATAQEESATPLTDEADTPGAEQIPPETEPIPTAAEVGDTPGAKQIPSETEQIPTVAEEAATPKKKTLSVGAFLGLLLFVMIPRPGTGAWTGSLVASLFDFPKKQSLLAVTLGVLGACVIMTLASEGVVSIFNFFL